jgi:predicted acetyltransferase
MANDLFIHNLKKFPDYYNKVIELIHNNFQYNNDNSFEIDFHPLISKQNHENCFILLQNNNLLAHIAIKYEEIKISNQTFKIALIGGIAVDKNHQGKGYFKLLFNHLLEKLKIENDVAFVLLWSEKMDMYKKFSFYPCIDQYSFKKIGESAQSKKYNIVQSNLSDLSPGQKRIIYDLYNSQAQDLLITPLRNKEDWKKIEKITSMEMHLCKDENDIIIGYFFKNKGQDLDNIIHEIVLRKDVDQKEYFKFILDFGEIWWATSILYNQNEVLVQNQFHSILRLNNLKTFSDFIYCFTNQRIRIQNLSEKQIINFDFEGKVFNEPIEDFLSGVFGPNQFAELKNDKKLFIFGATSI